MSCDFSPARTRTSPRRPESTFSSPVNMPGLQMATTCSCLFETCRMCSCPLTTTKNFVMGSLSSTMISFCSTVRRRPCARTRACWAEVRTGNISLGVLPGGGEKALSDVAVGVSFMESSLLELVEECDELRTDLLQRFFDPPMHFPFADNSVAGWLNQA